MEGGSREKERTLSTTVHLVIHILENNYLMTQTMETEKSLHKTGNHVGIQLFRAPQIPYRNVPPGIYLKRRGLVTSFLYPSTGPTRQTWKGAHLRRSTAHACACEREREMASLPLAPQRSRCPWSKKLQLMAFLSGGDTGQGWPEGAWGWDTVKRELGAEGSEKTQTSQHPKFSG